MKDKRSWLNIHLTRVRCYLFYFGNTGQSRASKRPAGYKLWFISIVEYDPTDNKDLLNIRADSSSRIARP